MPKAEKEKLLTISSKVPVGVEKKINERVVADNYGLKGRSKWLTEAVRELLAMPNAVELLGLSSEIEGETKTISLRIPRDLALEIERFVVRVRVDFPAIEGVKSKIIRTAIIQRFLRSSLVF